MSGLLAAIRLEQAGHPVRRDREERRRRRHLAREQLPRLPRRRRQPLLLLLVRAQPRLVGVLLAARRAARVLRALRRPTTACADRSASAPRSSRRAGTRDAALGRARCARRDGGEETLAANALISAVGQLNRPKHPRHPGPRVASRARLPLRRVAARARPRRQARRGDRHRRERVPARARDRRSRRAAAHRLPALAAVDGAEPALPRAVERRRRSGCCGTCRTTRAGTASCCSGPARTACMPSLRGRSRVAAPGALGATR